MSTCYIVSTPIGNLEDWSHRAIITLKSADVIYAEDTRHSSVLLRHFGINTRCVSFHEHNERMRIDDIKQKLALGSVVAIISDAGTPLISDPGFPLVRALREAGYAVIPIPGVSALITALSVAGIPSDRFIFEGFLPAKQSMRSAKLMTLKHEERTLIFYESSHRISAMLADCCAVFGDQRPAFIGREMTKKYESYLACSLADLMDYYQRHPDEIRGEFVVVIEGAMPTEDKSIAVDSETLLKMLLEEIPLKRAVALTARITNESKNSLYDRALALQNEV